MISTGRACPVTMTYFHVPGWIVRHNVRQRKNRYRPFLLEQTTGSVAFIHSVGSVFCCQSCKGFTLPDVASVAAGALRKREQIDCRIRGYNPLLQVRLSLQERTLSAISATISRVMFPHIVPRAHAGHAPESTCEVRGVGIAWQAGDVDNAVVCILHEIDGCFITQFGK